MRAKKPAKPLRPTKSPIIKPVGRNRTSKTPNKVNELFEETIEASVQEHMDKAIKKVQTDTGRSVDPLLVRDITKLVQSTLDFSTSGPQIPKDGGYFLKMSDIRPQPVMAEGEIDSIKMRLTSINPPRVADTLPVLDPELDRICDELSGDIAPKPINEADAALLKELRKRDK